MTPTLITVFVDAGWIYAAYSDGTVARKHLTQGIDWEKVDMPKIKNSKVDVSPRKPSSL